MSYQRVRLHHYQPSLDASVSKCSQWIKKLKPWKRIFRNYRKFWTCSLSDIIMVCRNLLAVWCISDLCNSNYICFDTGFSIETFYVLSWDSEQVKLLKHINTNYLQHAKLTCLYPTENLQNFTKLWRLLFFTSRRTQRGSGCPWYIGVLTSMRKRTLVFL